MATTGVVALFVVGMAVMISTTVWCARVVISANRQLLADLALLRAETLEAFRGAQHEENARLVADTRAATAKMNAMADALWSGLQGTVDRS